MHFGVVIGFRVREVEGAGDESIGSIETRTSDGGLFWLEYKYTHYI